MKVVKHLLLFLVVIAGLQSCKDISNPKSGSSNILLPNISGPAGEVLVVMDNSNWKGRAGNALRESLEQEYPALNQPEPLFDVIHITPGAFDNIFQNHRTIIIVSVGPEYSEGVVAYYENQWAKPQLVIRINAPDSKTLEEVIEKEKNSIINNIRAYDRKRLQDVYRNSKDPEITSIVSRFNITLTIPRGYNVDVNTDDFASFSIETPKTSQVIFIYQYPYSGTGDLKTQNLIDKRNAFLKKYTRGNRPGSYMTTAKLFPPMVYDINQAGRKVVEIRGLWELENDFMGGPFISHTIVDQSRKMVVTVEGYVYNPNEKKRNLMRQIEAIVYSMKLIKE
ncbi:MAG TPA: DUF4837 family protein [Bacteroidales bacterium]|nr:DUF4837 family protein [Bacteroidales bacterium]